MALTLKQFNESTAGMPEDSVIEIEAYFTPKASGSVPTFDVVRRKDIKRIVLLPERAFISDGESELHVEHKPRRMVSAKVEDLREEVET